jgi:hypothetical protein
VLWRRCCRLFNRTWCCCVAVGEVRALDVVVRASQPVIGFRLNAAQTVHGIALLYGGHIVIGVIPTATPTSRIGAFPGNRYRRRCESQHRSLARSKTMRRANGNKRTGQPDSALATAYSSPPVGLCSPQHGGPSNIRITGPSAWLPVRSVAASVQGQVLPSGRRRSARLPAPLGAPRPQA